MDGIKTYDSLTLVYGRLLRQLSIIIALQFYYQMGSSQVNNCNNGRTGHIQGARQPLMAKQGSQQTTIIYADHLISMLAR